MNAPGILSQQKAVIGRLAYNAMAYATAPGGGPSISFTRNDVKESRSGGSLWDLGFHVGSIVGFTYDPDSGIATDVQLLPQPERGEAERGELPQPDVPPPRGGAAGSQLELDPDHGPAGARRFTRAISKATRDFRKLIDTDPLLPGDLLLTRGRSRDSVSDLIIQTQVDGGYTKEHAHWTHAALYVGDGGSVVESTFESLFDASVRLTSLDSYCEGAHFLRVRRSRYFASPNDGWRVCVAAMAKLNVSYNFYDALSMWFKVRFGKKTLSDKDVKRSQSEMVICSTLYADAYNAAIRRSLGEINGVCVPAWLSLTDEFEDVATSWVEIR